MVGSFGLLGAMGAKVTVQGERINKGSCGGSEVVWKMRSDIGVSGLLDFLVNMAASADVLAMAKVEVDLSAIPEGRNIIIKWRGKPVFVRHRTDDEVKEARDVKVESLRDPQKDEDRVKEPNWLVMVGKLLSMTILLMMCPLLGSNGGLTESAMICRRLHTSGLRTDRRGR